MQATSLSPDIWNAIARRVGRSAAPDEVKVGKVIKRNTAKRHIWIEEYGEVAIPLVSLLFSFNYFDTTPTTTAKRTVDQTDINITMPKVGEAVVILDPGGKRRFPMCIGVIQSANGYWQGE